MDPELLADIHSSQGAIATETNRPTDCLEHYQQFMSLAEARFRSSCRMDDTIALSYAENELGIALMMNSREQDAKEIFERAMERCRRYCAESEQALDVFSFASANFGLACLETGETVDALNVVLYALKERSRKKGLSDDYSFM